MRYCVNPAARALVSADLRLTLLSSFNILPLCCTGVFVEHASILSKPDDEEPGRVGLYHPGLCVTGGSLSVVHATYTQLKRTALPA